MLNLAGVDLVLDSVDKEAVAFLERYIPTSGYLPWLRPTFPPQGAPGLTFPWQRRELPFKLWRFYWPQGASRWAYGHFLASSDQVAAITMKAYKDDGTYNSISLMIGTPDIGPQVGATPGSMDNQITAQVYLLPPTPLSGIRGLTGPVQSLYLISVVDQRWLWYLNSTGDMLQVDTGITWDDLFTRIADQLNLSTTQFTWNTVDPEYVNPSSMFSLNYQPIGFALDALAFNVGMKVVVNYDGTVQIKNPTKELVRLNKDFTDNAMTRLILAGGPRFASFL